MPVVDVEVDFDDWHGWRFALKTSPILALFPILAIFVRSLFGKFDFGVKIICYLQIECLLEWWLDFLHWCWIVEYIAQIGIVEPSSQFFVVCFWCWIPWIFDRWSVIWFRFLRLGFKFLRLFRLMLRFIRLFRLSWACWCGRWWLTVIALHKSHIQASLVRSFCLNMAYIFGMVQFNGGSNIIVLYQFNGLFQDDSISRTVAFLSITSPKFDSFSKSIRLSKFPGGVGYHGNCLGMCFVVVAGTLPVQTAPTSKNRIATSHSFIGWTCAQFWIWIKDGILPNLYVFARICNTETCYIQK